MKLLLVTTCALAMAGLAKATDHVVYPCTETYTVSDAETCLSIAQKYSLPEGQIETWTPNFSCNDNGVLPLGTIVCVSHAPHALAKRSTSTTTKSAAKDKKKNKKKKGKKHHKKGKKDKKKKNKSATATTTASSD